LFSGRCGVVFDYIPFPSFAHTTGMTHFLVVLSVIAIVLVLRFAASSCLKLCLGVPHQVHSGTKRDVIDFPSYMLY